MIDTIAPYQGALQLWGYESLPDSELETKRQVQFLPFIAPADDREEHPDHAAEIDAEIVGEVQTLLDQGGLADTE